MNNMDQDPNRDAAYGRLCGVHAMRVGILFVGYLCRPFTMQVTDQNPAITIFHVSPMVNINSIEDGCGCQLLPTKFLRDHAGNMRFFAALHPTAKRFLRVDDADAAALMRLRDGRDGDSLRAMYLTRARDISDTVTKRHLAALIGKRFSRWMPARNEIHVLAVLAKDPNEYPPRPVLTHKCMMERSIAGRVKNPRYEDAQFGSALDRRFHASFDPMDAPQFAVLREVKPLNRPMEIDAIEPVSFPPFDRIIMTRAYCGIARDLPAAKVSSLCRLAERAAIRHLLTAASPLYLDAVDCVVNADLYDGEAKVVEEVVCFVKFDVGVRRSHDNWEWGRYVDPDMLALLEAITSAADPCRRRLLLLVKAESRTRIMNIDRSCLPTAFPSVVVKQIGVGWRGLRNLRNAKPCELIHDQDMAARELEAIHGRQWHRYLERFPYGLS